MPKGRAKKKLTEYGKKSSDKKVRENSPENMNVNIGSYAGTRSRDETGERSSSRRRLSDCFQRFASRIANTIANRDQHQECSQSDNTRSRERGSYTSEQQQSCLEVPRSTRSVQTADLFEAVQNLCNPNKRLYTESVTPKTIRICLKVHQHITSVLIEMYNDQPNCLDGNSESCGRFQSQQILNLMTEGNFAGRHDKTNKTGKDKENEIKRRACRVHEKGQREAVTRQIRQENILEWLTKSWVCVWRQQIKNKQYLGEMKTSSSAVYSNDTGAAQHTVIKATAYPWNIKRHVPAAVVEPSNRASNQLCKGAGNPLPVIRITEATFQPHWQIELYKPSVARPADSDSRQYSSTSKGGSSLSSDLIGGSRSRLELFGKTETSLKEGVCISFEFDQRKHSVFLPSMEFHRIVDILREQIVVRERGSSINELEIPNKSTPSCGRKDLMKITINQPGLKRLTIESVPVTLLHYFAQRISENKLMSQHSIVRATKYMPAYRVEEPLQFSASAVEQVEQRSNICKLKMPLEMEPETRRSAWKGVINTNIDVTQRRKLPVRKSIVSYSHKHKVSGIINASNVWHMLWQPLHLTRVYFRDQNKEGTEVFDARIIESQVHIGKENQESARTLIKNGTSGEKEGDQSDKTEPSVIYETKITIEDRKIYDNNIFEGSNIAGGKGSDGQSDRGNVGEDIKVEPDDENAAARANEKDENEDWLGKIRGATSVKRGEFQAFKSHVPQNLDQIAVPVMEKDEIVVVTDEDGDEMLLSSGGFGKVYVARLRGSQELIIAKLIQDLDFEEVLMEAKVQMYLMSASYTPEILGIIGSPESSKTMILQELCADGRTLNEVIQLCDSGALILFEKHWLDLAHKLVINLDDMHEKGVLHNDIKPNNILVEIKPSMVRPVFIDFGWASFRRGEVFESNSGAEIHGSKAKYLAPEVRKGMRSSAKSDTYSLGKIFMDIADLFCEDLRLLALRMSADQPKRRPSLEKAADRIEELIVRKGF